MGTRNLNGFAGGGKHVFEGFPLVRCKLPKNVPGHAARPARGTNTHFQTRKPIAAEMLDDRLDPVVPSRRSFFPETQMPERQRNIIISDENIADLPFVKCDQLPHRAPTQVHESLRLHQDRPVGELREVSLPFRLCFEHDPFPRGNAVKQHEADIVPRIFILPAGITEADN